MDVQTARQLLPLVNDRDTRDMLAVYVESRIAELHRTLETVDNVDGIKQTQGRIAELRRIKTLRDEVIRDAEGSRY